MWFRYVQLEFAVESEQLTASFDVAGGMPSGHVMSGGGDRSVVLASFNDHDSFEAAMDEVMMPRLELTVIPAWQNTPGGGDGQAVKHAWVTYAGALFVAHNSLDNLLGDTSFSGLPGRLLQMFVGTPWASTMVEAQVATKAARAELEAVRRRAPDLLEDFETELARGLIQAVKRNHAPATSTPSPAAMRRRARPITTRSLTRCARPGTDLRRCPT